MKIIILESKDKRFKLDAVICAANDTEEAELLAMKVAKQKSLEFNSKMTTRVLGEAAETYKKPTVIYFLYQDNPEPKKTVKKNKADAEIAESDTEV